LLAPVRVLQLDPMPLDARPAQQLVETKRPTLLDDIAPPAKPVELPHETVDVPMLFEQVPIKPGQFRIVAVGVVVAQLGAAHLIAHQQHRHSR
jgi:hypothetical protein